MQLSDSAKMRQADNTAINEYGIPSTELMERAGVGILECLRELAPDTPESGKSHFAPASLGSSIVGDSVYPFSRDGFAKRAAIFAGTGNNGGDGVCVAGYLLREGWQVRVFLVGERENMSPDTRTMRIRFEDMGGRIEDYNPYDAEQRAFTMGADVIVDAIFGIGLNKPLGDDALSAVALINMSPAPVVSADIPSGVEADTGRILGAAVKADITVTFSAAKTGHYAEPGCTACGKIVVWDIGLPQELIEASMTDVWAMLDGEIGLPRRNPLSHKGNYGKLLIIAGSVGYTGAPNLCAEAAVKSGAGLVYLGVPESIYNISAVKQQEAMPFPLPDDGRALSFDAVYPVIERLGECDACVIGPGLGKSDNAVRLVRAVVRESRVPLVIDADGLYALSTDMSVLKDAMCPVILTPHDGEFAMMGGELTGDRTTDARNFAEKYGCCLVLKGHRTLVADMLGDVYITTHGNAGMAKGGTGDVLAGVLGAMLCQLPTDEAVSTGVFLHSLAGDMCRKNLGEYAMTASDIIQTLPKATKNLITE